MKIGIDISQIIYGTGVSVYTENLVRNILKVNSDDQFVLFAGTLRGSRLLKDIVTSFSGKYIYKQYPIPPTIADLLWNRLHLLKIEALIGQIDLFHSSDWTQPPSDSIKITTIHDLVPIMFPNSSYPRIISVHQSRLRWVKEEADAIIVPSKTTQNDLIALGFSEKKIYLIPEAADPIFKIETQANIKTVLNKYQITKKYLLSVGTSERKNLDRVITAYQRIKKDIELELVICGRSGNRLDNVPGVKFLNFIDKVDLPSLYSGAEVLVYPSLYEGFGLPVLEAFACACPVVTSNLSSLPEVAGDAGVLVDPNNTEAITSGIIKVLNNRELYVKKGLDRVRKYSWVKVANETISLYRQLDLK